MINTKEEDDFLNDYDYIRSIRSKIRYMNYGLSDHHDAEEKIKHYKKLQTKLNESQENIEDEFHLIEKIANNNLSPKRIKGALFDRKEAKIKRNGKRRGGTVKRTLKHDKYQGIQVHEGTSKVYSSELTHRENTNTHKRKNSLTSKKSVFSKENQLDESGDKSKLNVSVIKSEYNNPNNNKKDFKTEKNISIVAPNENNLYTYNRNKEIQRDKPPVRRKISNLKSGSILKNSSLFLTNIAEIKQQQNENVLYFETNNLSTNNRDGVNDTQRSSINMLHVPQEDRNNPSFRVKEDKSVQKHQGVLFDVKEDKSIRDNLLKKSIKDNSPTKNNNNNHSKSTAVDGTAKDVFNSHETFDFENKQNPPLNKFQMYNGNSNSNNKKDKDKSSLINEASYFDETKKKLNLMNNMELNLNSNFQSKNNLIHLSFSDSDSNASFLNYNHNNRNENTNYLLLKGKLPPLRIPNLDGQINQRKASDNNKAKNRKFSESINNNNNQSLGTSNKVKSLKDDSNDYFIIVENLMSNKSNKKDSINNHNQNDESNEKDSLSPTSSKRKANRKNILISPSKKSNIYNLKLPKLVLHQKNKSHLDILDSMTKELKSIGNHSSRPTHIIYNSKTNKNLIFNKPISPDVSQKFHSFTQKKADFNYSFPENPAEEAFYANEFFNTSENKLKHINTRRIKQKLLPLELEKPKHNNNKQGLKSQIFLKNFFIKCKNEQQNISSIMSDISSNIRKNTTDVFKSDPVQYGRKTIIELESEEIDKEVFHLDYPQGIREKAVSLKGPQIQGENKYSLGNKNSPMIIGEVISKMSESFAVRCKEVLQSRFILSDEDTKKRIKFQQEKQEFVRHLDKISGLHQQIEKKCEKMEKVKISAMKDMRTELN